METKPPDLKEQFRSVIEAWKKEHGLRDDDPVLLCLELFRLHQEQWDKIRKADLPSFQQFREDIAKLTHAGSVFRQEALALSSLLKTHRGNLSRSIPPTLAVFSITLALLAGLLLGGVFL